MDYRKDPEMPEQIQQKILINDLLLECIAILRRSGDDELAFNKLLGLVASFYGADRSYVFEFDLGSQKLSNTYEWCAEGIEAEIDKLQNLDIAIVDRWIVQFEDHGEFYINSTDGELDHDSDEYKILAMAAILSAFSAWTTPVPIPTRCWFYRPCRPLWSTSLESSARNGKA